MRRNPAVATFARGLVAMLPLVVTLPSWSVAAEPDTHRVVVTTQAVPVLLVIDKTPGQRRVFRHQLISVVNISDRPVGIVGLRVRNAEVLLTDGLLRMQDAISMDQGWWLESPETFHRFLGPGATTVFTLTLRPPGDARPGANPSPVELFFADGTVLTLE